MASNISVYSQLVSTPNECLSVIRKEIGLKLNCAPFAVKMIDALKELTPKTEQEQLSAANAILSSIQTLYQGGILAEDYDKIDFVKRGGAVTASARVEAFLRAAARKGYRISDTIVAVPKEDADTTYFEEALVNGDIVYILKDSRINPDRAITAERLVSGYFAKFICRLDIQDAKKNERVTMTMCEMSVEDMLMVASSSEKGIYKSEWKEYVDQRGYKRKHKVITKEIDPSSMWVKWTGEMVNKSIIRRALKRVREILPDLTETIYAFDDTVIEAETVQEDKKTYIEIPVATQNVSLLNPTVEQMEDGADMYDLFVANPKLAENKFAEIKQMIADGKPAQDIVNEEYASLLALKHSKKKWAEIGGYFNEKG